MEIKLKNIPKDWNKKKMKDIVKLSSGKFLPKNKQLSGKIPVYGGNGITGFHNKSMMEEPTIIVGRVGAHCGSVYLSKSHSWISDNAIFFTKISEQLELEYIFRYLSNININSFADISAQPKINQSILNNITIFFPKNKLEQQKIVSALSNIDKLLEQLTNLISKKKNIKQGAMQELLTGKRRLEGFSGEWKFDTIKNLAKITTGSRNTQDKIKDGQYPFFVRSKKIERINSFSYDGEAVLTAGDGVGTGKVFHYIVGKFDFHQRVYKISDFNENLDGYFFYIYFSNYFLNRIMSMTAKSSVDSVRMEMISEMKIPLPDKNEQKTIAQILSDMDSEIEQLEKQLEKYTNLKQVMMQKLLTGEIRLV